jgi:hypothetical protein
VPQRIDGRIPRIKTRTPVSFSTKQFDIWKSLKIQSSCLQLQPDEWNIGSPARPEKARCREPGALSSFKALSRNRGPMKQVKGLSRSHRQYHFPRHGQAQYRLLIFCQTNFVSISNHLLHANMRSLKGHYRVGFVF